VAPQLQFTDVPAMAVINQDRMSFAPLIQEFFSPLPQSDHHIEKAAALVG
jgi:hypothetical protein